MENGRHEVKFAINAPDAAQLLSRLGRVMKPDENAASGCYRVRSLYFDNLYDKALYEKLDGVQPREKFRIRLYNGDTSLIRLEKKSKRNGLCLKRSANMEASQCMRLLSGDASVLLEGSALCIELYARMRGELLRPRCIVDYQRTAFVYAPGNVRVTIDRDIRVSDVPTDFIQPAFTSRPASNRIVLEVKYDDFLPEVIRGLITLSSRQSGAFSKYATARMGF